MKAGMEVIRRYGPGNTSWTECTSAFSAFKDVKADPLDPFNTTTKRIFGSFTAGHCGKPGMQWEHNRQPMGTGANVNSFQNTLSSTSAPAGYPQSDSQVLGSPPVTPRNQVLLNSVGTYQNITSVQSASNDVIGERECFAGVTTITIRCGTLTSRAATVQYHEPEGYTTLYNQRLGSNPPQSGDSGGPVAEGSTAKGIVSGITSNNELVYTHIQYAVQESGWRVLTYLP